MKLRTTRKSKQILLIPLVRRQRKKKTLKEGKENKKTRGKEEDYNEDELTYIEWLAQGSQREQAWKSRGVLGQG